GAGRSGLCRPVSLRVSVRAGSQAGGSSLPAVGPHLLSPPLPAAGRGPPRPPPRTGGGGRRPPGGPPPAGAPGTPPLAPPPPGPRGGPPDGRGRRGAGEGAPPAPGGAAGLAGESREGPHGSGRPVPHRSRQLPYGRYPPARTLQTFRPRLDHGGP